MNTDIAELAKALTESRKSVVLTGAGISVPSGIPDFRSPATGIWENVDPSTVAHIEVFQSDPDRFWSFYGQRFAMLGPKQPNHAHAVVTRLERAGLIDGVVTQNIDMLHLKAGSENVVEMHGSLGSSACYKCGTEYSLDSVVEMLDTEPTPHCTSCGSVIKPSVVLFGEALRPEDLDAAAELCFDADLIVAIGSSLVVAPVSMLPGSVIDNGGKLALITQSDTPYDHEAAFVFNDDVVTVLQRLETELIHLGALAEENV